MKTIQARELSTIAMVNRNEKTIKVVIDEGIKKRWVGFGWVEEGKATKKDKDTYPTVVRS